MPEGVIPEVGVHADRSGEDVVESLRGAMRRLASGVAIVTAGGPDGIVGMAATSITSVTFNPPSVLVCINKSAGLHACIAPDCPVSISLLGRDQQDVAAAFGGAVAREKRFRVGTWSNDVNGLPILDGAQANLSCTVDAIVPYGGHTIVVARVEAVRLADMASPLIYHDGGYL